MIDVRVRLRPIRFAFLVKPSARALRRIFQLNTVLWGGRYNVIIPALRSASRSGKHSASARAVVAGYLEACEPDYIVADADDCDYFDLGAEQTLSLTTLLDGRNFGGVGLDVQPAYQVAYDKAFAFHRRGDEPLANVKGSRGMETFCAAVFGEFPHEEAWNDLRVSFETLGGKDLPFRADLAEPGGSLISPLMLGAETIQVATTSWKAAMILNPSKPAELIQFWNLRAFGWQVYPIPIAQTEAVLSSAVRFLKRDPMSLPSTLLLGMSIHSNSAQVQKLIAASDAKLRASFPRIWASDRRRDRIIRPTLTAATTTTDAVPIEGRITFRLPQPEFSSPHSLGRPAWAAVVTIKMFGDDSNAEVFPRGLKSLSRIVDWPEPDATVRFSTEGVTLLEGSPGAFRRWRIPSGTRVFTEWMSATHEVALSSAGRIAKRLVEVLGGLERSHDATHPSAVDLFKRMLQKPTRSVPASEVLKVLAQVTERKDTAERVLADWLARGVLAAGLHVKCAECSQQNWYALGDLDIRLRCEWCLEAFRFPAEKPVKPDWWAYRVTGPLAVKDAAQGAFTVVATLRMLKEYDLHSRITWTPSITLRRNGREYEADFAVLHADDGIAHLPPTLIFGECKTFGRFEDKDVAKMAAIGADFPRAVLVFATLKPTLDQMEVRSIAKLARQGRRNWTTPVVVLTSRELVGNDAPPECWNLAEDPYKSIYDTIRFSRGFRILADASQQIHLGLPPSAEWPRRSRT